MYDYYKEMKIDIENYMENTFQNDAKSFVSCFNNFDYMLENLFFDYSYFRSAIIRNNSGIDNEYCVAENLDLLEEAMNAQDFNDHEIVNYIFHKGMFHCDELIREYIFPEVFYETMEEYREEFNEIKEEITENESLRI